MMSISSFYYCKKGVCPYEYMDDLENFSETLLPEIEDK